MKSEFFLYYIYIYIYIYLNNLFSDLRGLLLYWFVIVIVVTSISAFNDSGCFFRNGLRLNIIFINVDNGWFL